MRKFYRGNSPLVTADCFQMGIIKRLPEGVRNTMRSGIILFDLTRVVEELVFNSLDAGATKASVYVGVGTCYVKVVDDGSGISRDGLALLGERYVTSKHHHLADMDAANGSFGFRGEALASISDISVLDIVTKACGKPNGYRKVMKGSKCLYLGIDDDRKDVGTTVVVRDLFYNQPVRRKCMQSSPKKVLYSVKKCVLRIALVHSKISFKVLDIESEDELLYTRPSSVLSLLMSGFGIQDSSSLHELKVSDGVLKLSGYISCPGDRFGIKVFQYIYINSRFVCKGRIHKLINHLATRFECLDPWKASSVSQKGKRSGPQACPAYIINLSCPSSLYDLTFESSKTYVDFEDWVPILTFIENAIQKLWRDSIVNGESLSHEADISQKDDIWKESDNITSIEEDFFYPDLSDNSEFVEKKCEIQNHQSSHHFASSPSEMLTQEVNHSFNREHDKVPFQEFYMNVSEFKEKQADMEFACQSDYSFQSRNCSLSKHSPAVTQKSDSQLFISDKNFVLPDDYISEKIFTARERSSDRVEGHTISSKWQNVSPQIKSGARNESARSAFSLVCHKFTSEPEVIKNRKKPYLQTCSSQRSPRLDRALLMSEKGFELPIGGFKTKRRRVCADEYVDILKADISDQRFDVFPRTLQLDEGSCDRLFPSSIIGAEMSVDFNLLSGASAKSFSSYEKLFSEEKALASDSLIHMESFVSIDHSRNSEWSSVTSDTLPRTTAWDVGYFPDDNSCELSMRSGNGENYWHFGDSNERECQSYDIATKSSSQDNYFSSCSGSVSDFKDYAYSSKDICKSIQGYNLHNEFSLEDSDIKVDKTDCLPLDLHFKGYRSNDKSESQGNQLRYPDWEKDHVPKELHRRSYSAPPFHKSKMRFVSLNCHSMKKEGQTHAQLFPHGLTTPESNELQNPHFQPNYGEDLMLSTRTDLMDGSAIMPNTKQIPKSGNFERSQFPQACDSPVEVIQESMDSRTKWRNGCQQVANDNISCSIDNQHNILDISSGFLHLAGISLVPESIHKHCLEGAKVLQQVDKKFIPVVAGGTLAFIDQHAADERIRLEELRQKVFSGEAKTVTYLDGEQELILPEIGYQLLHNYADQIRDWGWICNTQAQGSGTFKKNLNMLHQQPSVVTLLAVPCILGVNLSDGDLLEFLQQLADTDGSSMMPPSVLRVLNFKACRGAIMFGDSLLPSECALIVEELKQTSLCFQCAHGRPTTVPLVNLEALHKQIGKLGVIDDASSELWHGLHRQELSVERAAQRLSAARG